MMRNEKKDVEPVDIITITYQRLPYLKEHIEQIEKRTDFPYRLIVIDNGSTDKTKEWLLEQQKKGRVWKLVFNDKNEFLASALAKGFKLVESRLFVATQDDLIPPKVKSCWLTQMVELIDKHQEYTSITMKYHNKGWNGYLRYKKLYEKRCAN